MNKTIVVLLGIGCIVSFCFTSYYALKIVRSEQIDMLTESSESLEEDEYRVIFISSEEGHPFWERIRSGVRNAAKKQGVSVQFRSTFRSNTDEIIRHMDTGIAARVHGMIVEGIGDPNFVQTVNFASARGIPVITIVSDSPDSLRRTYVGSDHVEEGRLIARSMLSRIESGKVGLVMGEADSLPLQQRKDGFLGELQKFDSYQVVQADPSVQSAGDERKETAAILNQHPDCRVFIGFRSGSASGIHEEIRSRSQPVHFSIYTFDDLPETEMLLQQGYVKAAIRQNPESIGSTSLERMVRWLENEPLDRHYYIPFELME